MKEQKRIMSGMRPSGRLHLGHYLGVIKNWINLQNDYDCYFSIADWHALTGGYNDIAQLKENVLNIAIDWLACGIDPQKASIYVQSAIPEIAELNIYLGMITPQNWIERDQTIKDLSKNKISPISFGLMGFPILMSSDILAVNANYVAVGAYHVPEIELTRDIARRFNKNFETNYFNEPEVILNNSPILYGIDGLKMGKSKGNDIKISDSNETTEKMILQCITDRSRARKKDLGHPNKCEVAFKYWQSFASNEEIKNVEEECKTGKRGCNDCKKELAKIVNTRLKDIRERRKYYENHLDEVEIILKEGNLKSQKISQKILADVKNIIGMY